MRAPRRGDAAGLPGPATNTRPSRWGRIAPRSDRRTLFIIAPAEVVDAEPSSGPHRPDRARLYAGHVEHRRVAVRAGVQTSRSHDRSVPCRLARTAAPAGAAAARRPPARAHQDEARRAPGLRRAQP